MRSSKKLAIPTCALFVVCATPFCLFAAGPSVPATNNQQDPDSPNTALSAASLNVADQLSLVTSSIFSGGTGVFKETVNVFITSTLAASKPATTVSTKYQDAELLLPQGGVLNLFVGTGSVNYNTYGDLAKVANAKANGPGREQISDRRYFHSVDDAVLHPEQVRAYWIHGFGVRMLNRNSDTSTSSDVGNYGISGMAYAGLGADGTLSTSSSLGSAGNFRLEGLIQTSWTDSLSIKSMYPSASRPSNVNFGGVGHFQLAIASKLSVNVQSGWPIGGSRGYMGKVLLAGITLSR
jgi:hypothetical protein